MADKYLIFGGKTGWIGQQVAEMLRKQGKEVVIAESRLEKIEQVAKEIDAVQPTHVLNCAGLTGRPNVDWCEDHKHEVIQVNVVGTLGLLEACESRGIHCTNYATGCIYNYDGVHREGGVPIPEEYPPNYTGSYYSLTKGMVDKLSWNYKHVLTLRLRMPISDDLNGRNFLTKITSYARVINVQNSVTVLHDMLPIALAMADRKITGVFNFTNPGTVSHNECLSLYKQYIDPAFWYANFTEAEQAKVLKAGRCNNNLDVSKLQAAVPDMPLPDAKTAMVGVYERMRENLQAAGQFPPAPRKTMPKPEDAL